MALNAIRGGNMGGDEYRVLNKPRAFVSRAATHNIATGGAFVAVTWDTKVYDYDSMWDTAKPTRLTCNTPGEYDVFGFAVWPSNATNFRIIGILVNGGGARFADIIQPQAVTVSSQQIARRVTLNRDDYIELGLAQNTGGTLTLPATGTLSLYDHGLQACLVSTLG